MKRKYFPPPKKPLEDLPIEAVKNLLAGGYNMRIRRTPSGLPNRVILEKAGCMPWHFGDEWHSLALRALERLVVQKPKRVRNPHYSPEDYGAGRVLMERVPG